MTKHTLRCLLSAKGCVCFVTMYCQEKKECGALDSCVGLNSPHQQSISHSPIIEVP